MKKTATFEEVKACKCCYNCAHWHVDYSLTGEYAYNSCEANDTGGLILSNAAWCCMNFKSKAWGKLLPNVFGNPCPQDN